MSRENWVKEAREMPTHELHKAADWYKSLAEHYDDNMDFSGYHSAKDKLDVIKEELNRRG